MAKVKAFDVQAEKIHRNKKASLQVSALERSSLTG
jgi:hypothetical protein